MMRIHKIINRIPLLIFTISFVVLALLSSCSVANGKPTATSIPDEIPTESKSSSEPTTSNSDPLDLREANVVAVRFEDLGNGSYRFDVTLHHDDDGEAPKYADFWQVEDQEGTVLGKRILTHSHSSEPFTRSATISIPANTSNVIVRGHDMIHGFGGQAMNVDLRTGQTEPFQENNPPE